MTMIVNARKYGRRGGLKSQPHLYCIEGEFVTIKTIAERIGIGSSTVTSRIRRLSAHNRAITWELLRNPPRRLKGPRPRGEATIP